MPMQTIRKPFTAKPGEFPPTTTQVTSLSMGEKEEHMFLGRDSEGNGSYARVKDGGIIKFRFDINGNLEEVPV